MGSGCESIAARVFHWRKASAAQFMEEVHLHFTVGDTCSSSSNYPPISAPHGARNGMETLHETGFCLAVALARGARDRSVRGSRIRPPVLHIRVWVEASD